VTGEVTEMKTEIETEVEWEKAKVVLEVGRMKLKK